MKKNLILILLAFTVITIATPIAYYNSLNAEFIYDDFQNIVTNRHIQIEDLSFGSFYHAAFEGPTNRPLAKLTFALNYYFGGMDELGFHVVNLLIHIFNGWLVFLLAGFVWTRMKVINENKANDNIARFLFALSVATVFALHPVQTQSVTYIVQRMTSMCALFYFAGLLAFLMGRTSATRKIALAWWCMMGCSWVLAMATKEIAVTFPFAILLFEWFLFQKAQLSWLRNGLKYFAVFILFTILIGFFIKGLDFFELFTRGYTKRDFSLSERLLTEGRVMIHYISLVAFPIPSRLALVYDFPVSSSLLSPITTLISWLAIVGSVTFSVVAANRYPVLCFSILWFFLHLMVESTIIPLELVYEHRLYLPLFGPCVLLCFVIFTLVRKPGIAAFATLVIAVLLGIWTHQRNETWETKVSLWQDNLTKFPNEPRVNCNVGIEYMKLDENEQAMKYFQRSVEIEPNLQEVYMAIAAVHQRNGDYESAFTEYSNAISLPKENVQGNYEYDEAFAERGKLHARKRNFEEAVDDLDKAIKINPVNSEFYSIRAGAFVFLGKPYKAIYDYQKAINYSPSSTDAHSNLALFLATYPDETISKPKLAIHHAKLACELTEWKDYKLLSILAVAHARAGNFSNAISTQNRSIQLAPESRKPAMQLRLNLFSSGTPILMKLPGANE